MARVARALAAGEVPDVPYRVSDMAADGLAVLDDLGIERAHVMGVSMGGMIVQTMAIEHPERLLTMTSVMSTTGDPDVGQSSEEGRKRFTAPPPAIVSSTSPTTWPACARGGARRASTRRA